MKLLASLMALAVGGGIALPFTLNSSKNYPFRSLKVSEPIMVCESQDKKHLYRVDLAFKENWSSSGDNVKVDDSLEDLVFDVFDIKTGKLVSRLGHSSSEDAKFKLTIVRVSGGEVAGGKVNLQGKNSLGKWEATDCSKNNFKVEDDSCTNSVGGLGFCNDDKEFKKILLEWRDIHNSSNEKIEKEISIKSGNNLKWGDNFKPVAIFEGFKK